jgi:hypothetical protein
MHSYLTIELPDEFLANELRREMQSFDVDTVDADDHWELRIHLLERNPESRVTSALHVVDSWLATAGVRSVRVRLNDSAHILHAPAAPAASWRRPAVLDARPVDELAKG